jgi:hypothetical protein
VKAYYEKIQSIFKCKNFCFIYFWNFFDILFLIIPQFFENN